MTDEAARVQAVTASCSASCCPSDVRCRVLRLLADLREMEVRHGIATSGRRPEIDASLEALGVPDDTVVVPRGEVAARSRSPTCSSSAPAGSARRRRSAT